MSRPSQKRKKSARKPTPRHVTLETVQEDEALVATATFSSSLQDPMAIGSNAFRKASKRGRRQRKAKRKKASDPRAALPRTYASGALEAVWNEIDTPAKRCLRRQLRGIVEHMDRGREDLRLSDLGSIQQNVSHDVNGLTMAMIGFLTILRDGPIQTLREINARAEDMWNTRDEPMAESESDDGDSDSSSSISDAPMPNASDAMSYSTTSDSDDSMRSANSN